MSLLPLVHAVPFDHYEFVQLLKIGLPADAGEDLLEVFAMFFGGSGWKPIGNRFGSDFRRILPFRDVRTLSSLPLFFPEIR